MTFEISTSSFFIALAGIALITAMLIFTIRKALSKPSSIQNRNKFSDARLFKLRNSFLAYGSLTALAVVLLAFNWTQYDKAHTGFIITDLGDDAIELKIPRTQPPKQKLPPPLQAIKEIPNDISIRHAEVFETLDGNIDNISSDMEESPKTPVVAFDPPPLPKEKGEEAPFLIVEEMPAFPGCETISQKKERESCANQRLLEFIYKNVRYTGIAKENGIEGMAVVRFIIEKDGSISNAQVMREPGGGLGQEVLRIIGLMPSWNPGKQQGHPVRVQFTLPVKFKLD